MGPRQRGPRERDEGSATVLVLGALGVVLAVTVGVLVLVSAVVASHRAHAAADLAALAAASSLSRGAPPGDACATGGMVATRNHALLDGCVTGADLTVDIVVHVQPAAPHLGPATARARAGPASVPAEP